MRFSTVLSSFCSSKLTAKKSRLVSLATAALLLSSLAIAPGASLSTADRAQAATLSASSALNQLPVRGRAPKTGYARELFSDGWGSIGQCDLRNYILKRDLKNLTWRDSPDCTVATGTLKDPYTGKVINFVRGVGSSLAVQIDHVVAVSDAWQKGAQQLSAQARYSFYNDPLNLLAVDGPTNSQKSDSDAASWLPPNKSFRCQYVARQVSVKRKYKLWVTSAEKAAIQAVLRSCPNQKLLSK
jgi:hypothetical protein